MVFCEGEASEPDYIKGMKCLPSVRGNTSIRIEIDPARGVPLTLVQRAVERARDVEVDECWCVFDVEWPRNHPNLKQAVELAHEHGIRLAVSNPCFELWLILHFEDQTAFMNTDQAEVRSRKLDGRTGKRISADQYADRRESASRRASSLSARHKRNGTAFPNDNPSSTMPEFLVAISAIEPRAGS
ncbi:MAG TPA: RloB family protein [Actinokineospora sp.]|nr:RloB family protein [Actinokineospora sp.]